MSGTATCKDNKVEVKSTCCFGNKRIKPDSFVECELCLEKDKIITDLELRLAHLIEQYLEQVGDDIIDPEPEEEEEWLPMGNESQNESSDTD